VAADVIVMFDDVVVVVDDLLVSFDDVLIVDDVDGVVDFEVVEVRVGRIVVDVGNIDVISCGDDSDVVDSGEFPIPVDMQRPD
jgi:hypothetical protein